MKKKLKKVVLFLIGLSVFFFAFLVWFDWKYSMEVIEPFEVNDPTASKKVLIATQGSEFKNEITDQLVEKLETKAYYVQIKDITAINNFEASNWDAVVVMHTWEIWKPQPDAEKFLNQNYDKDKFVVLATSGGGDKMIEGVDGISAASIMNDVDNRVDELYNSIMKVLE